MTVYIAFINYLDCRRAAATWNGPHDLATWRDAIGNADIREERCQSQSRADRLSLASSSAYRRPISLAQLRQQGARSTFPSGCFERIQDAGGHPTPFTDLDAVAFRPRPLAADTPPAMLAHNAEH